MAAAKQQLRPETFNPRKRSPRHQQTERAFQMAVRNQLLGLLMVMNPQDQIHYGAMTYPNLVVYARDWLQTEVEEVSGKEESALKIFDAGFAGDANIREENMVEESGLGLDLG